ncbi:unnamed protein product [Rotaria socialis]|uniref:Uncharacterized protein n=1 Tax=Rotaria socialis TaxID=392032 RepID=A0A821E2G5_9BILA|nr:unnamed protein product [Rotaria socialis]CAF3400962.1 unnamed protein product [Rotaria socialis]CAF3453860.1 unnamed protein product [Rotaria socialis]CAF3583325.1 unnamed protein product [Rotaria socialis]CAF3695932.1 unnamed protein product [Rotaria socialis]
MDENNDQIIASHTIIEGLPSSRQTSYSNIDLDDFTGDDIDDDDIDDDSFVSIDEVQHIIQTFGSNDCSTTSIDYFDSRRYEIMYEIMNIERQFEELKNILYEDSVLLIDRKLISIQNEEAPEYQNELKKLYDEMKIDLEIAKHRRLIELQALEKSTESELLSLDQTLENDKFHLYISMREDIENKIHQLETLKIKTQLCQNILQEVLPSEQDAQQLQAISTSKKRFDYSEPIKKTIKKRRFNGAKKTIERDNLAIFYQLSDINIIEDWTVIQTSLQQSSNILEESDNNNDDSEKSDNCDDNFNHNNR